MLCPDCLTMNDDNAIVCTKCGRNFQTGEISKENRPPMSASFAIPVGRTALSIIAGYLGLLAILPPLAPISLVVSIFALKQLKENPGKIGRGRAVFGLVTGIVGTIILIPMLMIFLN
jgi:hypothetical protein